MGLALVAILVLAAFLRFWQVGTLPPGLYHDEAYNGLDALSLLQGKSFPQFYEGWELYAADAHADRSAEERRFPIFFEGNYGREPLHVYLMALSVRLLGATPFALRAVPAAAGVLAVLTTFLAAKALFNVRYRPSTANLIALLAAFLIAIFYPMVHFSRFGIRAMVFVPLETMAVACFWWGINRQERLGGASDGRVWASFLAAGFFLGAGIYSFAAARLLPLLWIVFVPLWFWLDRQALARHWRHVAVMAAAALLTALPLLLFFARYPYFFAFRIAYVANKGKGAVEGNPALTWLLNTGRVGAGLFWAGETHLRHNLPGRPYLDPLQGVLFVLGLVRLLRRALRPQHLFLLLWTAVMLLPSILSGDAPHFGRLVGAAAPLAITAAFGAEWLLNWFTGWLGWRVRPEQAQRLAWLGLAAVLGLSAWLTARDYFGAYAAHPDLAADFYLDQWQMGQTMAGKPGETRLFLAPTQEELATIYFALQDPERLRNIGAEASLVPAGTAGAPGLYVTRPGNRAWLEGLQAYFATGEIVQPAPGFVALEVPAGATRAQAQNASGHEFAGTMRLLGWTALPDGDALQVTLTWQALAAMETDYTAYVHLLDESGALLAQSDRPPAGYPTGDWVPGEIVADTFTVPLPPGTELARTALASGFYDPATLEALGEAAVLAEAGQWSP